MFRLAGFAVLAFSLALFTNIAVGQGEKEVTLKGTVTCAKCDLKKEKACYNVIVVKEKDTDVVYYFDKANAKKNHGDVCTNPTAGSVTGTVSVPPSRNLGVRSAPRRRPR